MRETWRRWVAAAAIPLTLSAGGCLSRSYAVSQSELLRLSQLPPEARWQAVRATQGLGGSDAPPSRGVIFYPALTVLQEPATYSYGGRWRLTPPRMGSSWGRRGGLGGGGLNLGRSSSPGGRSGGGSSGGGGGGGGGAGRAGAAILVAAVVAGAVIVFVLAGSEGARYDGWVAVNPNEELFLEQDGQTLAIPLPLLTPEHALSAYRARIYEGPGDRYGRIGRAPLNRVGINLTAGVGGAWLPANGVEDPQASFGGHTFLGYFPVQFLGLGTAVDVLARSALVATIGPELRVMPTLYAGAYVGGGWVFGRTGETVTRDILGNFARAGFLGELPVTTRMSFQVRVGAAWMHFNDIGSTLVPEISTALSIY